MTKYKVSYKNANGVIIEITFENVAKALNYIKTGLKFDVKEMKIEQFKITKE